MYNKADARIVIIEDDETIREGYAYLINHTSPYQVANTYSCFETARQHLVKDNPDVILLDIQLPGMNGIDAIPVIKKMLSHTYVIILTVFEVEKTILDALANGASGYFTKNTPSAKIIDAIKEVMLGGGPMSPNVARTVIKSLQKNLDSPLTKREAQILDLISKGQDRSQIANELFIEVETVKTHVKNIYIKLNVNSKADAIKIAKANRLI